MVSITTVRPGTSAAKTASVKKTSSLLGLMEPIQDHSEFSDEGKQQQQQHSAAQTAMNELEECYNDMLESIDTEKINLEENYVKGYITRSEKRRGGRYTKTQRQRYMDMARQAQKTGDKGLVRLLALELCIGIPPKTEKAVMAAFGKVFIHHREETDVLKSFVNKANANPNLAAYMRTILMVNRVENWVGKYEEMKERVSRFIPKGFGTSPATK